MRAEFSVTDIMECLGIIGKGRVYVPRIIADILETVGDMAAVAHLILRMATCPQEDGKE